MQEELNSKTKNFESANIGAKYSSLARQTMSVNLGQGFPDWETADLFINNLKINFNESNANFQYSRSLGSFKLVESIARNYSKSFKREINPLKEVLVSNGGLSILYNAITAIIDKDDEIILLEPFYDSYFPQASFTYGKMVPIALIPPKIRDKKEYLNISNGMIPKDTWEIPFDKLEKAFNDKTKMIIINTPMNPCGKVFTYEEFEKIKKILDNYPNVIVFMDEVYQYMVYDEFEILPRFASMDGMFERTITNLSAGKTFSATGIRIGYAIAPEKLIAKIMAIHQYNAFCLPEPLQNTIADCLDQANLPYKGYANYYKWLRAHYCDTRNYFIENLAKCKNFDADFFLPEGGYFVMCDISKLNINKSHFFFEEDENKNVKYSKDDNYVLELAHNKKVVAIPCHHYYLTEDKHIGENFLRLAFCKKMDTLDKFFLNLNNN